MLFSAKGRGSGDVGGLRLAGSQDGIHWNVESGQRLAHLHSDTHNAVVFDPRRGRFVLLCRPKHVFRAFGTEMIDTGASRRVARLSSDELWTDWFASGQRPQTILTPDERDNETHFNFFYGMPTVFRHGVYWGFLEPFRMNDFIQTELAISRDGIHFERFSGRQPIVPYRAEGTWDDEMILMSSAWAEVGDEWWLYYSGWDGPHGTVDRTGAVGLARIRREGFVSMRGPAGGGVVCTRTLVWPGGDLVVNANSSAGLLRVRVSDAGRRPVSGFDYGESDTFIGDRVRQTIRWNGRSLNELAGQVLRLEFYLQDADLFAFLAQP